MTDKELLDLAAKTIDARRTRYTEDRMFQIHYWPEGYEKDWEYWDPLEDDGHALRLAVKLGMYLNIYTNQELRITNVGAASHHLITEQHGQDPCAATRRAIVRAAAEIGKAIK